MCWPLHCLTWLDAAGSSLQGLNILLSSLACMPVLYCECIVSPAVYCECILFCLFTVFGANVVGWFECCRYAYIMVAGIAYISGGATVAQNVLHNYSLWRFPGLAGQQKHQSVCKSYIGKPIGTRAVPQSECGIVLLAFSFVIIRRFFLYVFVCWWLLMTNALGLVGGLAQTLCWLACTQVAVVCAKVPSDRHIHVLWWSWLYLSLKCTCMEWVACKASLQLALAEEEQGIVVWEPATRSAAV